MWVRVALAALLCTVPRLAMAEEPAAPPVKLVPLEELGIASAAAGGVALLSGSILLGVGLDAPSWRHTPPGQLADETVIAGVLMASGAALLGVGIPLALAGKARRERAAAFVVPLFGGAGVVGRF